MRRAAARRRLATPSGESMGPVLLSAVWLSCLSCAPLSAADEPKQVIELN